MAFFWVRGKEVGSVVDCSGICRVGGKFVSLYFFILIFSCGYKAFLSFILLSLLWACKSNK